VDIETLLRRGYVKASMPLEADTPIRPNAGVREVVLKRDGR